MFVQASSAVSKQWIANNIRIGLFYLDERASEKISQEIDNIRNCSETIRDFVLIEDAAILDYIIEYYGRARLPRTPIGQPDLEVRAFLGVERRTGRHCSNAAKRQSGGLAFGPLKRTCDAILAHLDADISLTTLAAIAGCSPTHFSRAFKQSMGVAPFRWRNERRIEKAKDLLTHSDLTLAEVALAVGFSAQPQFTTAFGRATGMTPRAWRRQEAA